MRALIPDISVWFLHSASDRLYFNKHLNINKINVVLVIPLW